MLLATAAVAGAATYRGEGRDDPKVAVSFEKERRTIKQFTIRRARFKCTDGDHFRAGTRVGRMRVRRTTDGTRKFSGTFNNGTENQTARIRGELPNRRRARGTFRLTAVFDEVGCTTRVVEWRATRLSGS